MLVAQFADALQKTGRHGQKSSLALHRLNEERGDSRGVDLRNQRVLQLPYTKVEILLLRHAFRRAVEVRNR